MKPQAVPSKEIHGTLGLLVLQKILSNCPIQLKKVLLEPQFLYSFLF